MARIERIALPATARRGHSQTPVSAVVPIRSFDGLTRLASLLADAERAALMQRLAIHTLDMIRQAGIRAIVVSNDPEVAAWGADHADSVIAESPAGGLNAAACAGVAVVDGPWIVVHADLPALSGRDVAAAAHCAGRGIVLAPSHDGGTSLIGSTRGPFPFSYGPGSFRRHLSATRGRATVLVRAGLALDLDRPWDLAVLERLGHL
jgi:2-phospho-L-lactate/phosphoenolpyruvate guanylyltransferase